MALKKQSDALSLKLRREVKQDIVDQVNANLGDRIVGSIEDTAEKIEQVIVEDGDKTRQVIVTDGDKTRQVIVEDGDKTRQVIVADGDKTRQELAETRRELKQAIEDNGEQIKRAIVEDGDKTRYEIRLLREEMSVGFQQMIAIMTNIDGHLRRVLSASSQSKKLPNLNQRNPIRKSRNRDNRLYMRR